MAWFFVYEVTSTKFNRDLPKVSGRSSSKREKRRAGYSANTSRGPVGRIGNACCHFSIRAFRTVGWMDGTSKLDETVHDEAE